MQSIKNSIRQQIGINESKNLLYVYAAQSIEIEPGFLNALEKMLALAKWNPKFPPEILFDMASFTAKVLIEKLYSVNQYLRIERRKVQELENIYWQTWQTMLRTRNIQATLKEQHYPELSRWVAALYPKSFLESLKFSPFIGHVVCEEYSAQLQIELLGINVSHIREPVIDIGCGSYANLVRYLRSLDIRAYGFDRSLKVQEPYLKSVDWFDYPFEPDTWGTIISNMAFTNHLVFAYQHDSVQFEQYLLKMRDVLESLTIGGIFYYAPSLPFVEQRFTPTQYKVKWKQGFGDVFTSSVTKIVGQKIE